MNDFSVNNRFTKDSVCVVSLLDLLTLSLLIQGGGDVTSTVTSVSNSVVVVVVVVVEEYHPSRLCQLISNLSLS